jgi:phage protein D
MKHINFFNFSFSILSPFLFLIFGLFYCLAARAQYMWLDSSGQKVFSDLPPPVSIPIERILQQPKKSSSLGYEINKKSTAENLDENNHASNKLKNNSNLPSEDSKKDKNLEAAKKKIDEEAVAKKKNELEAHQKINADNCSRAKQAKMTLDSGMRLSHTNAKGELGFMDDTTRLVEVKRLEGIISSSCK